MADIRITRKELTALREAVANKFKQADLGKNLSIQFNSMPDSYQALSDSISKEVGSSLSNSFLRDFFYATQKQKDKDIFTFREATLDTLNLYAHGKSRKELDKIGGHYKHIVIYAGSNVPSVEDLGFSPHQFDHIDAWAYDELILTAKEDSVYITLYVNEAFLKNKRGCVWLINLFTHHVYDLIRNLTVRIFVSPSLMDTSQPDSAPPRFEIASEIGRMAILNFWENVKETLEKFEKRLNREDGKSNSAIGIEDYNKLSGSAFRNALISLNAYSARKWLQEPSMIGQWNPVEALNTFLRIAKDTDPEKLRNIIKDYPNEDEDSNGKFAFYCTIGYRGYLQPKDRSEMLLYFFLFNTSLIEHNHKIIRIFSLPCKTASGSEWISLLKENEQRNENQQLFEFICMNVLTNVDTYLFAYLFDEVHPSLQSDFQQDYVIRIGMRDGINNPRLNIDTRLVSNDSLGQSEEGQYDKLYLAYPEEPNGINRLIGITERNDIIRFCEDYRLRLETVGPPKKDDKRRTIKIDQNNLKPISSLLGLDEARLKQLFERVEIEFNDMSEVNKMKKLSQLPEQGNSPK
ncbi:MAG: hypothetical protein WD077_05920 [Bacteroidia bacterium]